LSSLIRLGADGPRLLRRGGASTRLILTGRELCLFLHVDAGAVPAAQRAAFVALEVRRAAPFPDPEYDLAWFGDHAAVWYWSRERVCGLLGEPAAQARFRAEACFRGQPVMEDRAELLSLSPPQGDIHANVDAGESRAGVEARLWRQGHIVASRWWSQPPSAGDWQGFLRGGGMDPSLPTPTPEPAPLRERPLGGAPATQALFGHLRTQQAPIIVAAGGVLLAVLGWQLFSVLRISAEIRSVQQEVAPLEQQLETIIGARNRADDAAARIEAALSLRATASQTQLLAEVQTVTQGSNWAVMGWHHPAPDSLEVTLKGTGIDTAAVVSAWEQSPLLHEVTPATGARPDELMLRARLTSLLERAP